MNRETAMIVSYVFTAAIYIIYAASLVIRHRKVDSQMERE